MRSGGVGSLNAAGLSLNVAATWLDIQHFRDILHAGADGNVFAFRPGLTWRSCVTGGVSENRTRDKLTSGHWPRKEGSHLPLR
jgi:hypothetical protein